jgi:hypothetical protein
MRSWRPCGCSFEWHHPRRSSRAFQVWSGMEISNHVSIRMRYHHQGVIPLLGDPVLETRSHCLAYAFHRGKDIVHWVGAARYSNMVANLTDVLWSLRSTPCGCEPWMLQIWSAPRALTTCAIARPALGGRPCVRRRRVSPPPAVLPQIERVMKFTTQRIGL